MLQVMVTVGALHDKQSQEPSWIMEPLNCFSSELCQDSGGVPFQSLDAGADCAHSPIQPKSPA